MVSSCSLFSRTFRPFGGENRPAFTLLRQEVTLLTLPMACTFAFQSLFSFTCCSVCTARFTGVLLLHKFVSATPSFFCSSRRFPVPLVQNFPSLVLFFPTVPLSLPSCPQQPPLPPLQCHRVHMAPACDMKPCQNTPDALFNPPLFQPLLNFKQNKRERGRCWWGLKGKRVVLVGSTWCQGNVQQHHNLIHSLAPVHHQGRAALIFHFLNA